MFFVRTHGEEESEGEPVDPDSPGKTAVKLK